MKKNLSPYLIAASIIIGSVIISQAIISSSNNNCFNVVYKSLYEKPKPKEKIETKEKELPKEKKEVSSKTYNEHEKKIGEIVKQIVACNGYKTKDDLIKKWGTPKGGKIGDVNLEPLYELIKEKIVKTSLKSVENRPEGAKIFGIENFSFFRKVK